MIKYYPYKSDKPNKKYYIITNNNKKVYFGQAGASDFTIHKDEARKQRYINRHKNNDKMVIMSKSHTDTRGSDKYNLTLSERRAKSTVQYIISKGITASRISGKGMGELEPKEVCNPCTEAQHALNRRSEFLIVK